MDGNLWLRLQAICKGIPGVSLQVELKKQPLKYYKKVNDSVKRKILKGLEDISVFRGDIVRIKGHDNLYRYKMEHYRILFEYSKGDLLVWVIEINTRGDIHY